MLRLSWRAEVYGVDVRDGFYYVVYDTPDDVMSSPFGAVQTDELRRIVQTYQHRTSRKTDPMFNTRRRVLASVVVIAIAVVWWLRREPSWQVSLIADHDAQITPWQSVELSAAIDPDDATESHLLEGGVWHFSWDVDGEPLDITGPRGAWRSGRVGDHAITVTVESPWGTKKTATIKKSVIYKPFVNPNSPQLQTPNLAMMPIDPKPQNLQFGIADVYVEKDKICQGESTQIKVTPFDKRGKQAWLVPTVAGKPSWEITYQALPGHQGPRLIPIKISDADTLKGGKIDGVTTFVYVEVLPCVAPHPLFVDHRPIPPNEDDISFRVRLYDGPAWLARMNDPSAPSGSATATSYRWTFGDGTSATTVEPRTSHQYPREGERPVEGETSFKVRVDAMDGERVRSSGFTSITVHNRLRELEEQFGTVQLVATQAIGAQQNPDGTRSSIVTLTNIDPLETARIDAMKIHFTGCDGKAMNDITVAPTTVFEQLTVPPKGRITGTFTLAPVAGACYANAQVSGTSAPNNLKVIGFFQLMMTDRPPGVPVSDEQQEVLKQALKLIGDRKTITVEEIQQLENEGKIPRGVLSKDPFDGNEGLPSPPP